MAYAITQWLWNKALRWNQYRKNMYSKKFLFRLNWSDRKCFHTAVRRESLHFTILGDRWRHWWNYQLVHKMSEPPDTTIRRKSDMKVMDAEAPTKTISSPARRRGWNRLARIRLLHDPQRLPCRSGINTIDTPNSNNIQLYQSRPLSQECILMTCTFFASARLSTTIPYNILLFRCRSEQHWLALSRQRCRRYRDALDGPSKALTATVQRLRMVSAIQIRSLR